MGGDLRRYAVDHRAAVLGEHADGRPAVDRVADRVVCQQVRQCRGCRQVGDRDDSDAATGDGNPSGTPYLMA